MSARETPRVVDAVVVGAGFAGIAALRRLTKDLGLDAVVIEKAPSVGGTWYWNRYPGALSDTQSFMYQLPYEEELYKTVNWKTRYVTGPEIREYLDHAVDFFGLRSKFELDTQVESAIFDEQNDTWVIETNKGSYRARFLITALGLLSRVNIPDFPGIDQFQGRIVHTADWPADLDLAGKRIGVIGNGSTGVQFMTHAATVAGHLTSFQRTPQYSIPAGNHEWTEQELQHFKDTCTDRWAEFDRVKLGFGIDETTRKTFDVSPQEREEIFEWAWAKGGNYTFTNETFCDVTSDRAANELAGDFIKRKIVETVTDPETARLLTPTEIFARRPICDSGYFQIFNQPNVSLVSLRETPISNFTETGIDTTDGTHHEIDILVMATGFDAVDGSYRGVDIRGRGGRTLADHWSEGPRSHFGITVNGFPNMFMILGPNGPFVNLPSAIGVEAKWIAETIGSVASNPGASIEVRPDQEEAWLQTCLDALKGSLFLETASWIFGSNIPGKRKTKTANFYVGGLDNYIAMTNREAQQGYPSYEIHVPSVV
ncbi:NAD(P)/FAD-dependent oxidoreductase [Rhodococcus fascians]|nr:NAD(P)/FAD-dependent oxidoreductase [Rhodococcus fascians]MBY3825740.1 NAD(P)/FAD-dependent oxidoreductase [Rhodococcus fascians]MBY3836202.1 NAD(P)/FAD-dependent oxidoreductase [Rhodococcus fascians]MBY3866390.1 NAD(P)/FAD-dependent oxidoreductase [Rhodococcus fascians]MBY3884884.1 NAD(P)/FAD-dependent oxidoreductase [Rhodococcus fascians]